ncbi:nucleotidyltransferase domain-containing protein [Actinopolymorpha singaporensis]|uniref:Streptomycin adenylyltransferase n=1 Tax=Actinopolymorpha singaporensis TaxID=117157 RepID=A0A1H1LEA1_9ACTN|nr:aminoglycoside 6-adenylyltransferase [Actinopolymorpha singaporensis]SDR72836.1 Streptomycin adenylyltransferase [Actinopolymorpha singaporensis]
MPWWQAEYDDKGALMRSWHSDALNRIAAAAAADRAVTQAWVYGSGASGELDEWSDLDIGLVVAGEDPHKIAAPDWLAFLGPLWTFQCSDRDGGALVRAVFRDGRRVDLSAVDDPDVLPADRRRIDLTVSEAGAAGHEGPGSDEAELPALVHQFRFTAALAVAKDARDDLLIGGHLALELPRLCLVLAMLLRDRAEDDVHHRFGGAGNDVWDHVLDLMPEQDSGRDSVLDLVDASAGLFDELAARVWPDYVPDWSGLTVLLDRARDRSALDVPVRVG